MSKAYDRKLEAVTALRTAPEETALPELKKALHDRSSFVVAKAAAIVSDRQLHPLIPDLITAFERFLRDAVKTDPQCWGKNAIAKALKELEHANGDVFFQGTAHHQLEGTWGGHTDTAANLRATCALALAATTAPTFDILLRLSELLADTEKQVRVDAARAIAQLNARDGLLPLRLKALIGDPESEVIGNCFAALLSIAPRESLSFVARFLGHQETEIQLEAAGVLAESREPEALDSLKEFYEGQIDPQVKRNVLQFLAASPLEAAAEFLLSVVEDASLKTAVEALTAFSQSRHRAQLHDRAAMIVKQRHEPSLDRIFESIAS